MKFAVEQTNGTNDFSTSLRKDGQVFGHWQTNTDSCGGSTWGMWEQMAAAPRRSDRNNNEGSYITDQ